MINSLRLSFKKFIPYKAKRDEPETINETGLNINEIPNEILSLIFMNISANDICKNIIFTCKKWKEIIDSDSFWTQKLINDSRLTNSIIRYLMEKEIYNPKKIYFKNPYARNLIKNPCGDLQFSFWNVEPEFGFSEEFDNDNKNKSGLNKKLSKNHRHNNNGFQIEQDAHGSELIFDENNKSLKKFSTTHYLCAKYQLIDLYAEECDKMVLTELKPKIEVKDYYAPRNDCGSEYHIRIVLFDEDFNKIDLISFDETFQQWMEPTWNEFKHVFQEYPDSLRYILFFHGGKDTQFWAGQYGIKLSNSSVKFDLN